MWGLSIGTRGARDASDGGKTRGAEGGDTARTDEPHRTRADVFLETGLTPEEFVVEMIDARGGRLKQQAIIDSTGWAEGVVSTLLEMEDAGSVERVWIGREKMVYLPGAKPDRAAPPEPNEASPR